MAEKLTQNKVRELFRHDPVVGDLFWKGSVKGVCWIKPSQNWRAYICAEGVLQHLGHFRNFIDAVKARYEKECELNWNRCDSNSPAYRYLESQKEIGGSR